MGSAPAVMTTGVRFAVLAGFGRFAADEPVEIAALSAGGFFLVEKHQFRLVEFLEELLAGIPSRLSSSRIRGAEEFDADYARTFLRLRRTHGG